MFKRISSLFLVLVSAIMFLPAQSFAANAKTSASVNTGDPQIWVQVQRGRRGRDRRWDRDRDRGRHRGWYQGRHRGWDERQYDRRNISRSRLVRQTYWYNGRPYVRYVRMYY